MLQTVHHLTTLESLPRAWIDTLFQRTEHYLQHPPKPVLQHQSVALLFFEASTRTRSTFELAAKQLGAHVLALDVSQSSVQKGETLRDTALNVIAMGVQCLVVRHAESGAAHYLSQAVGHECSIVNAGDGMHAHPTQGLLDAFTIQRHKGPIDQLKIAIVGDIRHSRVVRSQIQILQQLKAKEIRIVAPRALAPDTIEQWGVSYHTQLDAGLAGVDVVIALRVQKERMNQAFFSDEAAYFRDYGITEERLHRFCPSALLLHPGPVNRDLELDNEVADGPRSVILKQVRYGLAVRMAVFELLRGTRA